ncbi:MAG TPA: hypothetical protein VK427_09680, partial [Kofleriaceae bacterium]|nr:hypothetical protein [Kofleriaceae bacterium]
SSIAASATVHKLTDMLEASFEAKQLRASMIDPTYHGTVSAKGTIKRRGMRWDGKVDAVASGVALGPDMPAIEGKVKLGVAGRRIMADVSASTFQVGGVRLVLDVDGPRDLTDVVAWRRLHRKAIRTAMLAVTRIDLAAAKVKTGGIVDGEIVLAGTETSGTFTLRGMQTSVGGVEGDINFAPMGDELGVSSTLRVENFGDAQIAAQIVIPSHPFEPAEWKRLGRGVISVMTATVEDVVVDPVKLAKLGVVTEYRGRANLEVKLAAGAGEARAKLELTDIQGGKLRQPLAVVVDAAIDPRATTANITLSTAKQPLVTIDAKLPAFGFDRWLADAKSVTTTPLEGKLVLPDLDVPDLLALFSRVAVTSGKLRGGITLAGTPLVPTAVGDIVVTNLNVKPRFAGRKLPTLTELRVKGTWDGTVGDVVITGKESDGATLDISARARKGQFAALQAKVDIRRFDIAPIAVFLPGPLVAATGKIGAKVTVTGLSPDKVRGTFAIEKARVPVHPQLGTIRDTNVSVKLNELG